MIPFAFPYRRDGRGLTAERDEDAHVRDLIEQFLFTSPGERPMRPTFGSGLRQLVFGAASPEVAAAVQYSVQAGLQQWLGDRIQVQQVEVGAEDSTLTIVVRYTVLRTQKQSVGRFSGSFG